MSASMTERVARGLLAIEESWNDHTWEQLPNGIKRLFLRNARAAIEAMREPSLDMLNAGRDAYLRTHRGGVCGMTIEAQTRNECVREGAAYRAMISAALSENEGEA